MTDQLDEFVVRLIEVSNPESSGARRLPPERELCAALNVSRGALREQLATLQSLGILRRRQGHGSYIDAPDASFLRTYFTVMRRLDYLSGEQFAAILTRSLLLKMSIVCCVALDRSVPMIRGDLSKAQAVK